MKKWTLQIVTRLIIIIAFFSFSCSDAEYSDSEGGEPEKPVASLDGTSWKITEQGVDIIPIEGADENSKSQFKTTTGRINQYYKERLEALNAIQSFTATVYDISYLSKESGEKITYENCYYKLENDSIILTDDIFSEEEKGVALLAGSYLTIRTHISKGKLISIMKQAKVDVNIIDNHIKEIVYQVKSKRIYD